MRYEMRNFDASQVATSEPESIVLIELPNGSSEKIAVGNEIATIRDLKIKCELQFGIPSNLQKISAMENPDIELNDWSPIKDPGQRISDHVIILQVPVWWNKFICVSLNNEIDNVCRRAKLPMQQISKEERLFVAYFIACCRGYDNALERLKELDIQIDEKTLTEAGRNLFHAAAAGGKVGCVEFVATNLITPTKKILSVLDAHRETPIDIARRLNHQDTERVLYKYMYHDKIDREQRSSAESGIEDCDSVCSYDSMEDRKTDIENNAPENTRNCEPNSEKKNPVFREVITKYNEIGNFPTETELRRETPPKQQLTSEVKMTQQDASQTVSMKQRQEREDCSCSSDSSADESSSPCSKSLRPKTLNLSTPNEPLLRRRAVRPTKNALTSCYPPKNTILQEELQDENENFLPRLENQNMVKQTGKKDTSLSASYGQITRLKQGVVQLSSNPCPSASVTNRFNLSPSRLSPTDRLSPTSDDEKLITKSAPGSPRSLRRLVFKPSVRPPATGNSAICPLSPKIYARILDQRRGSEPLASVTRTNGPAATGRPRRDAVINDLQHGDKYISSPMMHKRGKARSICEANLMESLRGNKDMDEEERMDRPWNAWIAVRRESAQLASPAENKSPLADPRRKSYQQWLTEKELNHLKKLFANAQEDAKTNEKDAKWQKGKTFEEWLEDKRKEMEREKEKEKDVEENQKMEEDKRHQRKRMSQAKYDKWLMQKEYGALQMEEKMEQEAKQQYELLKKKWEEEDERKRNSKLLLGRTQSLPSEEVAPRLTNLQRNRHSIK